MLSHIPLMIINWHHFNTLAHYSVANDAVVFLILYTQAPNSILQNTGLSTSLLLHTDDNDVNYNFVLLQWHTLLLKTDESQVAICFTQNTSAKHGLIGTEHGYIWRRQSAFSFCETKERCGSGGTYYFARHKLYIVNRYNNQRYKAWTVFHIYPAMRLRRPATTAEGSSPSVPKQRRRQGDDNGACIISICIYTTRRQERGG